MADDSWLPVSGPGADAFERTFRLRPDLYDGYCAFRDTVARESGLDAMLLARCAARVAWLLGDGDVEPVATDDDERVLFVFVDKFVRAPHGVTDGDVAALQATLSVPQVVGLTEALALLDGFTRFRLILGAPEV
jgi:hypothetical protein